MLTIQQIGRRYGHLMRVCRVLASTSRTTVDRDYYLNLRSCLWARATRELRRSVVMRR